LRASGPDHRHHCRGPLRRQPAQPSGPQRDAGAADRGGIKQTEASDKWNEFQANNIRRHQYEANARLIDVIATAPGKESQAEATRDDWKKKVADYEGRNWEP